MLPARAGVRPGVGIPERVGKPEGVGRPEGPGEDLRAVGGVDDALPPPEPSSSTASYKSNLKNKNNGCWCEHNKKLKQKNNLQHICEYI